MAVAAVVLAPLRSSAAATEGADCTQGNGPDSIAKTGVCLVLTIDGTNHYFGYDELTGGSVPDRYPGPTGDVTCPDGQYIADLLQPLGVTYTDPDFVLKFAYPDGHGVPQYPISLTSADLTANADPAPAICVQGGRGRATLQVTWMRTGADDSGIGKPMGDTGKPTTAWALGGGEITVTASATPATSKIHTTTKVTLTASVANPKPGVTYTYTWTSGYGALAPFTGATWTNLKYTKAGTYTPSVVVTGSDHSGGAATLPAFQVDTTSTTGGKSPGSGHTKNGGSKNGPTKGNGHQKNGNTSHTGSTNSQTHTGGTIFPSTPTTPIVPSTPTAPAQAPTDSTGGTDLNSQLPLVSGLLISGTPAESAAQAENGGTIGKDQARASATGAGAGKTSVAADAASSRAGTGTPLPWAILGGAVAVLLLVGGGAGESLSTRFANRRRTKP